MFIWNAPREATDKPDVSAATSIMIVRALTASCCCCICKYCIAVLVCCAARTAASVAFLPRCAISFIADWSSRQHRGQRHEPTEGGNQ